MEEALSGLPGIVGLQADLKNDRFAITYEPGRVTPDQMLETILAAGYVGDVTQSAPPPTPTSEAPDRIDVARLPQAVQKALEEAREAGRPLLLVFSGAG